jgi:hypothetical protein
MLNRRGDQSSPSLTPWKARRRTWLGVCDWLNISHGEARSGLDSLWRFLSSLLAMLGNLLSRATALDRHTTPMMFVREALLW